jgi:hypothetical protein
MDGPQYRRESSLPASLSGVTSSGQTFFRFTDESGRVHIVDSQDAVPAAQRATAEIIVLDEPLPSAVQKVDLRSFALGAAAGVALAMLGSWAIRARGRAMKLLILAAMGVLGVLAYLGWIRRTAGTGHAAATPQSLVEDAKRAVDKMNASARERDEEIKRIQESAK